METSFNSTKINTKNSFWIIALFSLSLLLISCGGNSTGTNGGNGGDDGNDDSPPTAPTFANVLQIFNGSCGGSGCHIGESESGVRLDSYENVMNSEGVQYGGPIVVPGEPENSPVIDKISSDDPEFGVRMPNGRSPLSNEQIALIRDWIAEGAENN